LLFPKIHSWVDVMVYVQNQNAASTMAVVIARQNSLLL
jgi:hypothetical protein